MTRATRDARRLSLLSSTILAGAIFATALGLSAPARADGGRGGAAGDGTAGGAGGTATAPTGGGGTTISGGNSSSGGGGGGVSSSTGFGGAGGSAFGSGGIPSGTLGGMGGNGNSGSGGAGGNAFQIVPVGGAIAGGTGGNGGSGGIGSNEGGPGAGGGGGGQGGYGALVTGSGLTNSSTVSGGRGGGGGSSSPFSTGTGGFGGSGGDGGTGILVTGGGSLTNDGKGFANGGDGGSGGQSGASTQGGSGGIGGIGVLMTGGVLTNNSTIKGGTGGSGGEGGVNEGARVAGASGTGGAGVVGTSLTIINAGMITGGQGGQGYNPFQDIGKGANAGNAGNGADGGAGISGSNLTITNAAAGVISGGLGGYAGFFTAGTGAGGVGIIANGAAITNRGTIQGGNGTATFLGTSSAGGIGIVGSNLTIDNAGGTIAGGFAGTSGSPAKLAFVIRDAAPAPTGAQAYAIQLTGGTNYIGTGGTINGGINVTGTASFMPALPGSAVGTPLNVTGPLTFASTSTYNIRVTPTASDSTAVTGAATLNGAKVAVSAGQGTYQVRQYTILTASAGVTGTFNPNIASNLAFLTPTLSYDANGQAVYLNIQAGTTIAPPVVANNGTLVPNYTSAANTQNQMNVAAGLTNAGVQNGGKGPILNGLNQLTTQQAQAAFDSLSGEGIAAAQNVANRSTQLFTSSIFDQTTFYSSAPSANSVTLFDPSPIRELADLPSHKFQPTMPVTPNRTWRAWATGFGGVDNIHGNGVIGSSYQQNTIYGGTLGVDYQLMPNYLVGVAVGGTNGDFRVAGRATSGSSTGGHVAFYDLATFGAFYGASSTSFSYFGNRATRTVSGFGGLGTETERANFNSNEFRSRLEFGRHFAGYGGVLTPFVALELAQLRSNGFTESAVQGAGLFRLNVSGQSQASAPAFVGVRLQRVTSIGNGITISPTLQVAYVHEFAPYRSQIGTLVDLPGSTFLVDGARPARNAAQVKAGAEMAMSARSALFVNFDGEFSGVNQLYAGKGGFRYAW